jgi:hypothetical protein
MKTVLSLVAIAVVALVLASSRHGENTPSTFATQFSPAEGISCLTESKNGVVTVRGVDSRTSPPASETYTRDGNKITHKVVLHAVAHEYCMDMVTRHIAPEPDAR